MEQPPPRVMPLNKLRPNPRNPRVHPEPRELEIEFAVQRITAELGPLSLTQRIAVRNANPSHRCRARPRSVRR